MAGMRHIKINDDHCHRATVYAPLCQSVTSSTKPEVHNGMRCRQRRTEPRPQATPTEKFGRVVDDTCERTDRQTDTRTDVQPR